ncbi:MAG: hypothetical protein ACJ790_07485 [Myxococcaceae bacterium]
MRGPWLRTVSLAALLAGLACSPDPTDSTLSTSKQALTLSDPVELDTSARASELSAMPVFVRNDGQNFIVGWSEQRSVMSDVYTTRVTPAGVVLDPFSVRATRSVDGVSLFGFAVGGGEQLMAWEEWIEPGVLIQSSLGAPGQTPSFPRFNIVPAGSMAGSVAATWDGTAFDVVMPHAPNEAMYFVRVFPDGGSTTPAIIIPGVGSSAQDVIGVARSGNVVGVTSYENGIGYFNHLTIVDPSTASVISHQTLSTANDRPLILGDGRGFVIADQENILGTNRIKLLRASPTGALAGDAGWDVTPGSGTSQAPYALESLPNGNVVVAYGDNSYPGIKEVSEDAGVFTLVRDALITDAGTISSYSSVSCLGATCLMVWPYYGFPSTVTAALYANGSWVKAPFPLRTTARPQLTPKSAFAQDRYLVVWTEESSQKLEYFGRFLDESGAPLSPPFLVLSLNDFSALTSPGIGTFNVAELGGRFLFVNGPRNASPYKTVARFIELDGGVGAPFDVVSTGTQPKANLTTATVGSTTLVLWMSYDSTASHWMVYGARVASDGTVLDPNGFVIADTGYIGAQISASAGERGFQVIWSDYSGSFGPPRLLTASIDADAGTLGAASVLVTTSGRNYALSPSLGFDGVHHFATWVEKPDAIAAVRLIEFDEDGGVIGDGGELLSSSGADAVPGKLVCRDGECTAVYSELVGNTFQLRGLKFSADGGRQDLGSSLATVAEDEVSADIALGDAGWLLAWSRYQGAPYGTVRAIGRVLDGPVSFVDAGTDAGIDAGSDAGVYDGGVPDGGERDAGEPSDGGEPARLRAHVGCDCDQVPTLGIIAGLAVGVLLRRRARPSAGSG